MLGALTQFSGPQDPSNQNYDLNTVQNNVAAWAGGLISISTGASGTAAGTSETTLKSASLPVAAMPSVVGQQIVLEAAGTTGANADDKTIKLKFGAIVLSSGAVAANALPWKARLVVVFLTTGTQYYYGKFTFNGVASVIAQGAGTVDLTAAVTCSVTGQNEVATLNDAVCSYFAVSRNL